MLFTGNIMNLAHLLAREFKNRGFYFMVYLFEQSFIVVLEIIAVELESFIIAFENSVVSFQLLGFPTGTSVLKIGRAHV